MVNGLQQTIRLHVDDIYSSHMNPKANDELLKWMQDTYGKIGEVKATRGKVHDYLGMIFDFSEKGKLKINMSKYVKDMIKSFPEDSTGHAKNPATSNLFEPSKGNKLSQEQAEAFHTAVAKGLFICKRGRPDIHTVIAVLCTRVQAPTTSEWEKLKHLMKFLNSTADDVLTLSAENLHVIKWYVDAAFAVHPDFKSHTGGAMTYGHGVPISMSRKQRLNTTSSTSSELVGADDLSVMILWTKLFLEAQGYEIKENILYQDNKSTILLEKNGKRSSSKRTRALNIRYFFLTDQIQQGNLKVKYCPTDKMVADYLSKPLMGKQYETFRKTIMGMD